MPTKRSRRKPTATLLPARMSLNMDMLSEVQFATLEFPFAQALDSFLEVLKRQYNIQKKRSADTSLDYDKKPPYRQLNSAIMALCPVLVHGFESYGDKRYMVAFNNQHPQVDALIDLIDLWIDHWLENADLKSLVDATMSDERKTLKAAIQKNEIKWHEAVTLQELVAGLAQDGAMGYNVIPAAIIALLHGQTITLQGGNLPQKITWRKAHNGGARGLHLVSQPFHPHYVPDERDSWKKSDDSEEEAEKIIDGYYVYQLYVGLETQVGRLEGGQLKPWIFLKVGMRRYAHEPFKKDSQKRNLSILAGINRDQILPENREKISRYPYDTTLISLPVDVRSKVWDSHLAELLSSYGLSSLEKPENILNAPAKFGNLEDSEKFKGNEYYVIHAEGRTYTNVGNPTKGGHNHRVATGLNLKERTEIIQRVLELISDTLIPDIPFEPDIQPPKGRSMPLALRTYPHFAPKPKDTPEKLAVKLQSTLDALGRIVANAEKEVLDIAIIYHDTTFAEAAKAKLEAMFPGYAMNESDAIKIHLKHVSASLVSALDSGALNPQHHFDKANRPKDFYEKWAEQMKSSRYSKIETEWRPALKSIAWRPNAHRLALIESFYETKGYKPVHTSQDIKGAVREACCRENVASQFTQHFHLEEGKKLSKPKAGKLENALLDLLLRGTGATYGTPAELYKRAANLQTPDIDVVAFWHIQKQSSLKLNGQPLVTVLAVRLRADGTTHVLAPGMEDWIPYAKASAVLGKSFADLRSKLRNAPKTPTYLTMKNDAIMRFVHDVLRNRLNAPTIAVVPANWWRNAKDKYSEGRWTQLGNKRLFNALNTLDMRTAPGGEVYQRDNPAFENLLGVIRLRKDSETPHYTTGTLEWDAEKQQGDLVQLSGYVDCTVQNPMHYFSVASESKLQERQSKGDLQDAYKMELKSNYSYKHAQLVELLPFYARQDFSTPLGLKILCRCVHFLRVSPSFKQGNILLPYPMHLAKKLLDDLMCIVDAD